MKILRILSKTILPMILAIIMFGCNSLSNENKDVCDSSIKFWGYIKKHKYEKAWKMGSEEFRAEYKLDEFINNTTQIFSNDVEIIEVNPVNVDYVDEKSCIVKIEILFNKDETIVLFEDWIYEHDKWFFNGGGRGVK